MKASRVVALSWLERQAAKVAWGRVQKKMPKLKRWIPLIGTANLVIIVTLRLFGLQEQAEALSTLGGLFGLDQASAIPAGELAGVIASASGIFLKIKAEVAKARSPLPPASAAMALMLALLGAAPASAQVDAAVETGTAALLTRGERREYIVTRVTALAPVRGWTVFARGELAGTQDGGGLDLFRRPDSFRSIEVAGGVRHKVGPLGVGALYGVTWSVEGADGPLDPRLHTLALTSHLSLGEGYAYGAVGHHGPSGGMAGLAGFSLPVKGAGRANVDFALPFSRTALLQKAWQLRVGATVVAGRWKL